MSHSRLVPALSMTGGDPPEISPRLWAGFTGSVAYDVGSNAGQSFEHILRDGFTRLYGFEPERRSYDLASVTASRYMRELPTCRIDVNRMAVSDQDGTVRLASITGTESQRSGQLVTIGTDGMPWSPPSWEDTSRYTTFEVPSTTLDTFARANDPPDFIKIDTEGHEVYVLEGASRLLYTRRPAFLVEFHTPANCTTVMAILTSRGYEVDVVRHPHYLPRTAKWRQAGWIRAHHPHGTGYQ